MGCNHSHFGGKSVPDHLVEARKKGAKATHEHHGIEAPGHLIGGADAAKDVVMITLLIQMISLALGLPQEKISILLGVIIVGLFFWKVGRSAALGWSRLERVNNLMAEEKFEIENNREEERDELREMYKTKGFSGELLDRVIDVLMADDNKLLGVMLEEELGVSLESHEHPLKQAFGTGIGVLLAAITIPLGLLLSPTWGLFVSTFVVVALSSYVMARIEAIRILHNVVWQLAITFASAFSTFFFVRFMVQEVL